MNVHERPHSHSRPWSSPRVARWLDVAASIGFVLAALFVLWRRFNATPGAASPRVRSFFLFGDLLNYYVPMTENAAARLAAGEVPLWNPEACSGLPFLATLQTAIFYPGTWLALALPAHRALPALAFAECALGGAFALWLFRSWNCGRFGSAAGAVLFVFACCLGQTLWPPAVATIVWIPWLLLCVERLARGGGAGWWLGLALGSALQILAGFPQYLVYGYFLVGPLAALRLVESWRAGDVGAAAAAARAARLTAALALGVGLAAVQLLPTLELVGQSGRAEQLSAEELHYLNQPRFQRSDALLGAALDPSPGSISYGAGTTGYVGIATLVLLVVGVVARRREPLVWLLLGLGGLALLLSDGYLGPGRPLYAAYAQLPFVGSLRTPERLRVVTSLCISALAAAGFGALEGSRKQARERVLLASSVGVASFAVGAAMIATGQAGGAWRALLALGLAGSLAWGLPRSWLRGCAAASLAGFLVLDLALATLETGALRGIPERLVHTYHTGAGPIPRPVLARHRQAVGDGRLELNDVVPFVGAGPAGGVRRMSCYEPLVPAQWARLEREIRGRPGRGATLIGVDPQEFPVLFDVTSVRRVIAGTGRGLQVVDNPDALPRVYLLDRWRVASRDEALRHVADGDLDFRKLVLLEREPGLHRQGAGGEGIAPARLVEDLPERVVVEAEASSPALLVLTDSHYPGWEARVDGQEVEILLANGLHRAVPLPPGRHQVVFEYRPASFRRGVAISLASLATLAAVGLASLKRGRLRSHPKSPDSPSRPAAAAS